MKRGKVRGLTREGNLFETTSADPRLFECGALNGHFELLLIGSCSSSRRSDHQQPKVEKYTLSQNCAVCYESCKVSFATYRNQ